MIIKFLWVNLIYFIHYTFQNSRFKGCFRENLLRKGIFQFRFIVIQSLYSRIESDPVGDVRISLSQNVSSVRKNTPSCIY